MTQNNTLIFDDEQTCAHITTDNHLTSKPIPLQQLIVDKNFEDIFCNKDFPVESYLETIFIFFHTLPSLHEKLFQFKRISDKSGFIFPYVNTSCKLHIENEKLNYNISAEGLVLLFLFLNYSFFFLYLIPLIAKFILIFLNMQNLIRSTKQFVVLRNNFWKILSRITLHQTKPRSMMSLPSILPKRKMNLKWSFNNQV